MNKPEPDFFKDKTANEIGKKGEENTKNSLNNSHLVGGSGSGGKKGDIEQGSKKFNTLSYKRMIEKKSTDKKSMVLKKEWLEKASRQAFKQGKDPVICIEFETTKVNVDEQWALIPFNKLKELLEIVDKYSD